MAAVIIDPEKVIISKPIIVLESIFGMKEIKTK